MEPGNHGTQTGLTSASGCHMHGPSRGHDPSAQARSGVCPAAGDPVKWGFVTVKKDSAVSSYVKEIGEKPRFQIQ